MKDQGSKFFEEITAIYEEIKKAEIKHPNWPTDNMHKQVSIITEEVGEVAQAVLKFEDEGGEVIKIRQELREAGAMCFRMLLGLEESLNYDAGNEMIQ